MRRFNFRLRKYTEADPGQARIDPNSEDVLMIKAKSGLQRRNFLALMAASAAAGALPARRAHAEQVAELWHYLGAGGELDGVNAMMAEIDKSLGGRVAHRVVPGGAAGVRQQVQVSLMGGVPPLAYQISAGVELSQLAKSGRFEPLDDIWSEIDGDATFPAGLLQVVSSGSSRYGIPFSMSMLGNVWYNKAVFEKLGLSVPTNWDEWLAVCEAIKAAGISPLTSASGPAWTTYQFYGPLLDAAGEDGFWEFAEGRMSLTDPRLAAALDLFAKNFVPYFDPNWTGAKWADGLDALMRGDVAMYCMGDWASGYMKQRGWTPDVEYGFFQSPGISGYAIFQSDVAVIVKGDKSDLGKEFAKALSGPEAQGAFAKNKGSLAPNKNVDPSIYDVIGQKEYEIMVSSTVLPNLYTLLPPGLKEDFGSAIEKFGATRDRAGLDAELTRLEPQREQRLAAGEFGTY